MRFTRLSLLAILVTVAASGMQAPAADLQQLITDINNSDKLIRVQAMDGIAEQGASAADAVPALVAALSDSDEEIVWHAARTLGAVGEGAAAAVPNLIAALDDDRPKVRAYAAYALGRIGKPAMAAADKLIELAFDKETLVRRAVLPALRRIDPPQEKTLPLVMKILEQGDMSVIIPALGSLAEQGKEAVPKLRSALKHEEAQYWACLVLAEIGPDAADAVPEIVEVLDAQKPQVRLEALVALGEIGAAAKSAVPAIAKVAENDEFKDVRYAAIYALGKLDSDGIANKVLQKVMKSDDEFGRTIGAWALARTNPANKELVAEAVNLLVDSFKSEDVHVRQAAARAIVEFDVDREVVAPLLVKALEDKDPAVVANAIAALASLGPKALGHVDDALSNKALRHYAIRLIARLGREADVAVPALVASLGDQTDSPEDLEFVREAHFALSAIGPGAKDAIPVLVKGLASTNEGAAASAAYALGKIGAEARSAVPALQRAEGSESVIVKAASVFALWQIQPGNPARRVKATTLLLKALEDERELVRAGAATMLGELGNTGERATAKLKEVSEHDSAELVRQAAGEALKKITS
ncbi:MAG: HEAT repeat domain-containing protein [Planctomycetaceae bacterium]|nr:HEAT repeat domain-containing protein [Planctomycetales bacterium]MCB9926791.1 HEAT repeat domain-containing protein [Planctomycetaceae bacterium]